MLFNVMRPILSVPLTQPIAFKRPSFQANTPAVGCSVARQTWGSRSELLLLDAITCRAHTGGDR